MRGVRSRRSRHEVSTYECVCEIGNASLRIACTRDNVTRSAGCINDRQSAGSIPCNNTFGRAKRTAGEKAENGRNMHHNKKGCRINLSEFLRKLCYILHIELNIKKHVI